MRKGLFLVICAAVLAACTSAPKSVGINAVPAQVTKAIVAADKTCAVNADCVAVQKGCCVCAGYEAVNVSAAEKVQNIWNKACANGACTREMCYTRITPKCVNNQCMGEFIHPKGAN